MHNLEIPPGDTNMAVMDTQLLPLGSRPRSLELDFIGDLACPWSFIGKRNLTRALDSLYGATARVERWHGLPLAGMTQSGWREHLASRHLPAEGERNAAKVQRHHPASCR